jgi:hypothetical protein
MASRSGEEDAADGEKRAVAIRLEIATARTAE